MFDINGPYAPIPEDIHGDEARAVESVMIAGMKMREIGGLVLPFHIPPAVALAIVRAMR